MSFRPEALNWLSTVCRFASVSESKITATESATAMQCARPLPQITMLIQKL